MRTHANLATFPAKVREKGSSSFEGKEVIIEKRGDEVLLKPVKASVKTFGDVIRELQQKFPDAEEFPEIERPKTHERPVLEW